MDLMDIFTPCIWPFLSFVDFFLLYYLLPLHIWIAITFHRKEHTLWTIVPLTLGICCTGYYLEGNYHYLGFAQQHARITTYMDSGFRTSKTLHVNLVLTLSTPRLAVTETARGQYLLSQIT